MSANKLYLHSRYCFESVKYISANARRKSRLRLARLPLGLRSLFSIQFRRSVALPHSEEGLCLPPPSGVAGQTSARLTLIANSAMLFSFGFTRLPYFANAPSVLHLRRALSISNDRIIEIMLNASVIRAETASARSAR